MFLPSNITLKFGDSGDFVSELQRRLAAVHCFDANAINGFYDGVTVNGVSQFQSMSGIRADGIAGPETLRRLNGVISGDNSSTTDHKAEEEKRQQQELSHRQQLEQQYLYEQQALLAQQQQQQAYAAQMQAQANAQSYTPQPLAPQPQTALPEVIVANILAKPLMKMARDAGRKLRGDGVLILSGLLNSQETMVLAAHRAQGLYLKKRIRRGKWSILVLAR
jgi:hypothetical protein